MNVAPVIVQQPWGISVAPTQPAGEPLPVAADTVHLSEGDTHGPSVAARVGLAVLAAASVAGALGTATPALAAQPAPQSQSQSTRHAQTRNELVRTLGESGSLHLQEDAEKPDSLGQRIDGFTAKKRLDAGETVMVRVKSIETHESFWNVNVPPTQRDIDAHARREAVEVRSWTELEQLNAAERLTSLDTSYSLTAEQRALLPAVRPFEGGPGPSRVTQQSAWIAPVYAWDMWGNWIMLTPGGYMTQYRYTESAPAPAIHTVEEKGGGVFGIGAKHDRLTAYEAVQELQSGRGLRVRTSSGSDHVVRSASELQELRDFERR